MNQRPTFKKVNEHRLEYPSFRYVKVREVKSPIKEGADNAGIDFFVPTDLTFEQLEKANEKANLEIEQLNVTAFTSFMGQVAVHVNNQGFISTIWMKPGTRIIIPSGIKGLLDPIGTMLQANNKSGVATKKGLIYGAEVVDTSYTGEIHISLINTSNKIVSIDADEKIVQFVHIPVLNPTMEEMDHEQFEEIAKEWSARGSNWQGSTNKNC